MTDAPIRVRVSRESTTRVRVQQPDKIRVRVLPSLLPKQIEIDSDGTNVRWRYVNTDDWNTIVAIADISATVEVGAVTTLAPGLPATVANVGTDQAVVLDFGIPRGADGTAGVGTRTVLTANTTYHAVDYPSPNGVGGETGIGTAGNPFVGPQFAVDWLQKNLDTAGYDVRLEFDSDIATENAPDGFVGIQIYPEPLLGGGLLVIAFTGGSKCRCSTSGTGIINNAFNVVTIENSDFDGSDDDVYFTHLIADAGETDLVNPKWGKSGTADRILVGFAAVLTESGAGTIYGGGGSHATLLSQGSFGSFSDYAVTGDPKFTTAFVVGEQNASILFSGTFTGSATGIPYIGRTGAAIISTNPLPGDADGQLDQTSSYNFVFGAGGVPKGGTTGQVFVKASDADFDTEWVGLGTAALADTGTSAGNVPVLDGSGLLDTSVLPALAITDVFIAANQAAMLALTAQKGDIAIRSDLNKSFALSTNSPSTLADWKELLTPTDAVLSVAGLTGSISAAALKTALAIAVADITDATANGRSLISAADYAAMRGLLDLEAGTDFYSVSAADTLLALKAPLASPALTGNPTAPTQTARNNSTRLASTAYVDGTSRETLTAARTYSVGAVLAAAPTISIASPAVVTAAAHGLSAGDAVVFNVPQNLTAATISAANPAVVTMANTFAAGQPVTFASTGSLPYGIVPGTTYYVIATGLSSSQFEVSATVGGTAVDTTPPTATFTNGSANIGITTANTYYKVGQTIRFATSGGLPTNFAVATDYYIVSASSTLITVAATNGGSAIVAGSAGTGTQTALQAGTHYTRTAGLLPTGITEGTAYFVSSTNLVAGSFQLSDTAAHGIAGTNQINATGSVTGSPIYNAYTGNDANTGLAATRAAAFLTIQKAVDSAYSIDPRTFNLTIKVCDGVFTAGANFSGFWFGSGFFRLTGNTSNPSNCFINVASGNCIALSGGHNLQVRGFKVANANGQGLNITSGSNLTINGLMEYGACLSGRQIIVATSTTVNITSAYFISGPSSQHAWSLTLSNFIVNSQTVTILDTPSLPFAISGFLSYWDGRSMTFIGNTTGTRYNVATGSIIDSGGGGASYFPGSGAGSVTSPGVYI